jgi:superfamily II DNA or RNA helicase
MPVAIETPPTSPGARVRVRGDEWILSIRTPHTDCEAVRLEGCAASNGGVTRTLLLPFDRLLPATTSSRLRIVGRRAWLHHVSRALSAAQPFGAIGAAAGADIRLMPFQLEPALAMLRHARLRLLITDEVGLGKTIQSGVILSQLSSSIDAFRAIVLTPAGVREQWQQELLARFAMPSTLADAAWLEARARDLPPEVNPWSLPGIYVASFDLVKRPEVLRALEDVTWDIAVLDEIHGAGPGTQRLAAAHAVACVARRVVLLTATPPDGDPAHLAALTNLGRLGSPDVLTAFRRTREDAGIPSRRKSILLPVRLSRLERRMHRLLERYTTLVWTHARARQDARARLAAVILRKRALSSAASLLLTVQRRLALLGSTPALEARQLLLPLLDEDPPDDRLPDDVIGASGLEDIALERDCLEEIAAVSEQASRAESKLALLRRLLSRTSEPMIIFTEYRDTLAHIAAAVARLRPALLLHGGLTPAERTAVQRSFNQSGSLLLATDAASEGLNLHERCRLVVHFELPWTPARLEQRTGRVDRLGQRRAVHEVLLVARDTCERLVLAPLVKRARSAASRGGRSSRAAALSESAVAEAVMAGVAPADEPPPPSPTHLSLDLRAEGTDEAARLAATRSLIGVSGAATRRLPPTDVAVTMDPHPDPQSAVLIVEAALEREDGRRIHTELVPVAVHGDSRERVRTATAVKAAASDLIRTQGPRALAAAEASCERRFADVAARYHGAAAAAARRERAVAGVTPSVAQRLVQVGLFDSRGIQALAARRRTAALAVLEADERLADLSPHAILRSTLRIVAVRLGRWFQP